MRAGSGGATSSATRLSLPARRAGAVGGAGASRWSSIPSRTQRLPSKRSWTTTRRPTQLAPPGRRGRRSEPPSQLIVASGSTRREYSKQKTASGGSSPDHGRQAGAGSTAGTAKRRLWRGTDQARSSFASSIVATLSRRSSELSRSWSVPQSRSARPLACGLRAPIQRIPAASRARPTWVRLGRPASGSASVGGRFGSLTKIPWRSVERASGRPWRSTVWPSRTKEPAASSPIRNVPPLISPSRHRSRRRG
jgi:hypothetical protein